MEFSILQAIDLPQSWTCLFAACEVPSSKMKQTKQAGLYKDLKKPNTVPFYLFL